MAGLAIKPRRGFRTGAARAHQRRDLAVRFAHQPEAVAADVIHVRIDGGDRRRHRDHRLDRIAAFGENGAAILDRGGMRRADDAAADDRRCGDSSYAASVSPRFLSSASTVGSRPRNAL